MDKKCKEYGGACICRTPLAYSIEQALESWVGERMWAIGRLCYGRCPRTNQYGYSLIRHYGYGTYLGRTTRSAVEFIESSKRDGITYHTHMACRNCNHNETKDYDDGTRCTNCGKPVAQFKELFRRVE